MNKKKKNILSQIGAVIVAVLCMVTPMSAFAAEGETISTIDENKTGSITVYKYNLTEAKKAGVDVSQWTADGEANTNVQEQMANYAIKDVEFTYVKVADINTASVNGKVDVVYNIPEALQTILDLSGTTEYTSTEINNALSNAMSTDTKAKLTEYVKNNGGKTITTNATGFAQATNLDLGLYLMVETKFPNNISEAVTPFFVSVPMTKANGSRWFYDVTVYPKNETDTATVDKYVRQDVSIDSSYNETANGSVGDKMDYIFVSHLPQIGTDKNNYLKNYYFTDVASKGLTYVKNDVVIRFYDKEADARANNANASTTWNQNDGNFTVDYDENADDGTTKMIVTPTDTGYETINQQMSGKYMVVSYSATINANAVLGDNGNKNEVTLKWNRQPSDSLEEVKDDTKVFSFGLNLTKTFEGNKTADATKVEFILQNTTDKKYITANGSDGVYKVTGKEDDEKSATVFKLSTDKKLKIDGIEADTYELTEIATSDGYSLLKEPITIVITKNGDVTASATVNGENTSMSADNGSASARVDLNVVNTATFTLPMTGGAGTILFTLCGCLLALVGISIITGKKKTR